MSARGRGAGARAACTPDPRAPVAPRARRNGSPAAATGSLAPRLPLAVRDWLDDPVLGDAVAGFDQIGLQDLAEASLMDRTDTRYVLPAARLAALLSELDADYHALEVAGTRLGPYETLYFDTADLALFRAHHQGRADRIKIRERHYAATGRMFLEVKRKSNKGRTVKRRAEAGAWADQVFADPSAGEVSSKVAAETIATGAHRAAATAPPSLVGPLGASLFNSYRRVTLVSRARVERVTLDTGLCFHDRSAAVSLDGLAIVEVKRDDPHSRSEFMDLMRRAGIRPLGLSKYCLGIALLHPGVKHNRFKPRIRAIMKAGRVLRHDS